MQYVTFCATPQRIASPKVSAVATLKLNPRGLAHLRKAGLAPADDRALAELIGVDRTTIYRILAGQQDPSAKFVAGSVLAFGKASFNQLFTAVRS